MKIHLIDYLAYCSRCNVSDLSSLPQYKLFYEVQKVPAENCTLEEWRRVSWMETGEVQKR